MSYKAFLNVRKYLKNQDWLVKKGLQYFAGRVTNTDTGRNKRMRYIEWTRLNDDCHLVKKKKLIKARWWSMAAAVTSVLKWDAVADASKYPNAVKWTCTKPMRQGNDKTESLSQSRHSRVLTHLQTVRLFKCFNIMHNFLVQWRWKICSTECFNCHYPCATRKQLK